MRIHRFGLTALAAAFVTAGALTATPLLAQQPAPGQQAPAASPPKPYKPVTIKLPVPVADPAFVAFRKQVGDIAQKKDRAALAKLVAQSFFFVNGEKDAADKKKPGIENLAKALSLDGKDSAAGWATLGEYAKEPTAEADEEHKGVLCAPADPAFDENAAEALAKATQTDPGEWGYPVKDGVEVRAAGKPDAAVTDKLGLYLVRVYPDNSPAAAVQGPTSSASCCRPARPATWPAISCCRSATSSCATSRTAPTGRSPALSAASNTVLLDRPRTASRVSPSGQGRAAFHSFSTEVGFARLPDEWWPKSDISDFGCGEGVMWGFGRAIRNDRNPLSPPSPRAKSGLPDFAMNSAQVGQARLAME